jgi:hypothetical protein
VQYETDRGVGIGELEQLLDVLSVRNDVHILKEGEELHLEKPEHIFVKIVGKIRFVVCGKFIVTTMNLSKAKRKDRLGEINRRFGTDAEWVVEHTP